MYADQFCIIDSKQCAAHCCSPTVNTLESLAKPWRTEPVFTILLKMLHLFLLTRGSVNECMCVCAKKHSEKAKPQLTSPLKKQKIVATSRP